MHINSKPQVGHVLFRKTFEEHVDNELPWTFLVAEEQEESGILGVRGSDEVVTDRVTICQLSVRSFIREFN